MSQIEEVKASLERIQRFDVETLPRLNDLGTTYGFSEIVEVAKNIVNLFTKLPISSLGIFPRAQLKSIRNQADVIFNTFDQILKFNPKDHQNPLPIRQQLITQLINSYDAAFSNLFPLISFALANSTDLLKIENDANEIFISLTNKLERELKELNEKQKQADSALNAIRSDAAEKGVSQEAYHFDQEAEWHFKKAGNWLIALWVFSATLITYGALSIFIHKIPALEPKSIYETVQLIVSKLIIFGVLAYVVVLCGRNYQSHKHNETLNKQRRNALKTYKALVEGAIKPETQDIVLQQAARCIFEHQETGFTKNQNTSSEIPSPIIGLMHRTAFKAGE